MKKQLARLLRNIADRLDPSAPEPVGAGVDVLPRAEAPPAPPSAAMVACDRCAALYRLEPWPLRSRLGHRCRYCGRPADVDPSGVAVRALPGDALHLTQIVTGSLHADQVQTAMVRSSMERRMGQQASHRRAGK